MDKKCIFILVILTTLSFFIRGVSASGWGSSNFSVGASLSQGNLAGNFSNANYFAYLIGYLSANITGNTSQTTTTTSSSTNSSSSSLGPNALGPASTPATFQQYVWSLTLTPQAISVLNFSSPSFGANSSFKSK